MPSDVLISLSHVSKEYRNDDLVAPVLFDINLVIKKGEFIAITGPSGSGKSTLLNILGLLDNPTGGTYILNNTDVTQFSEDKQAYYRNKEIGFVFQSFNLLKRTTAFENVVLPAIYAGTAKNIRERKARELLEKVGLKEHITKTSSQLSGGQQQRVAIARSLMNDPNLILADEPTGNLDTKSGNDVMQILKDLNKEGKTVIMITHESEIAKQAKKTIFIRDGKIGTH